VFGGALNNRAGAGGGCGGVGGGGGGVGGGVGWCYTRYITTNWLGTETPLPKKTATQKQKHTPPPERPNYNPSHS